MRKNLSRALLGAVAVFCLIACRERLLTPAEFTQAHISAWRANLFLLRGSEDAEGLARLKKTIAEQREDGGLLTSRLFLYKDGTLTERPAEE